MTSGVCTWFQTILVCLKFKIFLKQKWIEEEKVFFVKKKNEGLDVTLGRLGKDHSRYQPNWGSRVKHYLKQ